MDKIFYIDIRTDAVTFTTEDYMRMKGYIK